MCPAWHQVLCVLYPHQSTQFSEMGIILMPILLMSKLRPREGTCLRSQASGRVGFEPRSVQLQNLALIILYYLGDNW